MIIVHFVSGQARRSYRMICGSWILEHFDNKGKGRERCSERGGGDRGGVGKGLYCSAVSWQMKRAVICRKHLLSSLFLTNNGHETHFFQRKTRHSNTLPVDFNPRKSNAFFVQIRGVVNLQCALKAHRDEFCVEGEKSVQCAFLLFFPSKLSVWIAPLFLVEPFYHLLWELLFQIFFFFWNKVEPGFTKVQNQSPSEVSMYDPPCGVLELL